MNTTRDTRPGPDGPEPAEARSAPPLNQRDETPDYVRTYQSFWQEIVENGDGTLNLDQIMRELHDYHHVMGEVSLAYDDVTDGRMSKPNTAARHVMDAVAERVQAAEEEARKEARREVAHEIEEDRDSMVGGLRMSNRAIYDRTIRIARGQDGDDHA